MTEKLRLMMEDQVNKELWSAYIYLGVAEYYKSKGLDGYHDYFEHQAKEEVEHAEKFMDFMHDRDLDFKLKPIEAPVLNFKDLREPLVFQLEHEKLVTSLILALFKEADKEEDFLAKKFLSWYLEEQLEEEARSKGLIDEFDLFGKDGAGLYKLNKKMGKAE
jgi:ferritin